MPLYFSPRSVKPGRCRTTSPSGSEYVSNRSSAVYDRTSHAVPGVQPQLSFWRSINRGAWAARSTAEHLRTGVRRCIEVSLQDRRVMSGRVRCVVFNRPEILNLISHVRLRQNPKSVEPINTKACRCLSAPLPLSPRPSNSSPLVGHLVIPSAMPLVFGHVEAPPLADLPPLWRRHCSACHICDIPL